MSGEKSAKANDAFEINRLSVKHYRAVMPDSQPAADMTVA